MNAIDYTFNDCPIVTADDGNTYSINERSWNGRYYRECRRVERSGEGWIWDLKAPTVSLRPVDGQNTIGSNSPKYEIVL